MSFRFVLPLALLPFSALAYACSDDPQPSGTTSTADAGPTDAGPAPTPTTTATSAPPDATAPTPKAVELKFEGRIGTEKFACGKTFAGIGTSAASANAGDFRFFVHDVKLLRGSQEFPVTLDAKAPWQSARVGLVDFEDKTGECEFGTPLTNDTITGTALGEGFDGITFTVGVPEDLNHRNKDTEAPPLPGSGMNWSWTTGYIHFAVQLNSQKTAGDARVPAFYSHVGSTQCVGDPADGGTATCARKNRPVVRLTGFDPTKDKIVIDGKKLLETSDIDVNGGGISGCMSGPTDPECPAVFAKLGLDFTTGTSTGSAPVFSVEKR